MPPANFLLLGLFGWTLSRSFFRGWRLPWASNISTRLARYLIPNLSLVAFLPLLCADVHDGRQRFLPPISCTPRCYRFGLHQHTCEIHEHIRTRSGCNSPLGTFPLSTPNTKSNNQRLTPPPLPHSTNRKHNNGPKEASIYWREKLIYAFT